MADHRPPTPPAPAAIPLFQPRDAALLTLALAMVHVTLGGLVQVANLPFGLSFSEIFLFAAPAFLLTSAQVRPAREALGLGQVPWRWVGLGLLLGIANYPIAGALEAIGRMVAPTSWIPKGDAGALFAHLEGVERLLTVFSIGIVAPFGEELFFRGLLLPRLRRGLDLGPAMLMVGTLFSAIHFDLVGFPARLELGLLFCWMAARSGSLWPAMAAHAASNLFALGLFFAIGDDGGSAGPTAADVSGLLAGGLLVVVPLLALSRRMTPHEAGRLTATEDGLAAAKQVPLFMAAGAASMLVLGIVDPHGLKLNYGEITSSVSGYEAQLTKEGRVAFRAAVRAVRNRIRTGEGEMEPYLKLRKALELLGKEKGLPEGQPERTLEALRQLEQTDQFDPASLEGTPDAGGKEG